MARPTSTTRVSETIARRIKRQMSNGKLRSGQKLPAEREMARKYKTSRVSVREAYRSLEELGLLVIRRGADGGAFIAEPDHNPVQRSLSVVLQLGGTSHQEMTEARLMIEPPIARLAARRATATDIDRLRTILERQESALAKAGHFRGHSLQFHRAVADCAGNLPLVTMMNSLADLTLEIVTAIDTPRPVKEGICRFHRAIFEAIERHDEDAAYQLMREHIGEVQEGIGETIAETLRHERVTDHPTARPARRSPARIESFRGACS